MLKWPILILIVACTLPSNAQSLTLTKGKKSYEFEVGDYIRIWTPHPENGVCDNCNVVFTLGQITKLNADSITINASAISMTKCDGKKKVKVDVMETIEASSVVPFTVAKTDIHMVTKSKSLKKEKTKQKVAGVFGAVGFSGFTLMMAGLAINDEETADNVGVAGIGMFLGSLIISSALMAKKRYHTGHAFLKNKKKKVWSIE